jgi:uncharacterized protein (DUF39 family)/CBS domain-containing protein
LTARGAESIRTYEEVNKRIEQGGAVVMTADDFVELARSKGLEAAASEVDVVTTGTFGAMCSSGAFLNFGHSDPPIRMKKCWLNEVPSYAGLAAVDTYIGATSASEVLGIEYGGGHVIEDLASKKEVHLRAEGRGTDCYPRRFLETSVTLEDLNQATLLNPRNGYERYNAATNTGTKELHTYMGTLLPRTGNVTYSGSGELSPIYKDLGFETIGIGTRIFLGGGIGYVIGEGTQHNPENRMGTLMVKGDLKRMSPRFLRGATFLDYGPTLYVGLGIPIPIINLDVARSAALSDSEILTEIKDYSVASRDRPSLRQVDYAKLKSGAVEVNGRSVPTSPLSSFGLAKEVAVELKSWIEKGSFFLSRPAELLADRREFKPMKTDTRRLRVKDVMSVGVPVARSGFTVKAAASLLQGRGTDHLPVVDEAGKLVGIVTSWDISKAVAIGSEDLPSVTTTKVVSFREDDAIDKVADLLTTHGISGGPVVDADGRVVGLVTISDITRPRARGRK